jgi:hypothetical protein
MSRGAQREHAERPVPPVSKKCGEFRERRLSRQWRDDGGRTVIVSPRAYASIRPDDLWRGFDGVVVAINSEPARGFRLATKQESQRITGK